MIPYEKKNSVVQLLKIKCVLINTIKQMKDNVNEDRERYARIVENGIP